MQFKFLTPLVALAAAGAHAFPQEVTPSAAGNGTTSPTLGTGVAAPTCIFVVVNGTTPTLGPSSSEPTIGSAVSDSKGTLAPAVHVNSEGTIAGRQEPTIGELGPSATILTPSKATLGPSSKSSQSTIYVTLSSASGTIATIFPGGSPTASIPLCVTSTGTVGIEATALGSLSNHTEVRAKKKGGALGMPTGTPIFGAIMAAIGIFLA
ncbi:hypothetical protein CPB83DRAFT_925292 [Crepidotus variabilis]|uniref:Uncharacterized protein n=1 Tax=Crepidotus variabilis TaxID=179855 RepID=A0A9P6EIW9_9AGAR|nr:hypothetical protein CPB83DRAFT_925292 [Crepidotus variabilis]